MIYVTGDTHADFRRFSTSLFPEQKDMTKNDCVIICGDFGGIWHDSAAERYWLEWLNEKPFTTLYVDGNHENFDRYYGDEFEDIDMFGGKVQKISDSIFHLKRGEIYEIQGKKFFAFGGASSHDIKDGIIDPQSFETHSDFILKLKKMRNANKQFRVKGLSWWPQELPSQEEMQHGIDKLANANNEVDYVITHCLPQEIASTFSMGLYKSDDLTMFFNKLLYDGLKFYKWYCGHYHVDVEIMGKFEILYDTIERIV